MDKSKENNNNNENENENENENINLENNENNNDYENNNEEENNENINKNLEEDDFEDSDDSDESEDEEDEEETENKNEDEKISFLEEITNIKDKKSKDELTEEIVLNIHFKTFIKNLPSNSEKKEEKNLKKEESLLKFNVNKLLQKKKIKYKVTNEFNDNNFFIILSKDIPKELSDIYSIIKKVNIEIEDGFVKNVIFVVLQEGEESNKCDVFKSNLKEMKVLKLYIKKGEDKDGRKSFLTCTNNRIQMDYIINSIQNFYELKIKELESISLEDVNNEELELEEESKDNKLTNELFSNSVIIFTNINDTKKLTLKDPSKKIRLILSSFDKFMKKFPENSDVLCPKIFNTFTEKDNFFIETKKAFYLDASIFPIGAKDSDLHQYITQVYNHYSLKNLEDWNLFESKNKNKFKNNILSKYLSGKQYIEKVDKVPDLFGFDINYNQCYPTFILEDMILPLIAKHNEKIKILIPCFIKVNIQDNNTSNNLNKTKNNDSTLYLISYLYYSEQRIYLYPLYFVDTSKQIIDSSKEMEEIKKNILQNTNYYFTEIIKSSVLYSFVKIQFGGVINYSIDSIQLMDLNFHQNHFFTVFFQLFYTLMNLDKKPNEVLDIFAANDLIDHYYIFLQFVQELCDKDI